MTSRPFPLPLYFFLPPAPSSSSVSQKSHHSPQSELTSSPRPDQTFEILINDESVRKGSLFDDFDPAVNPPKEIDDPEDFKPESWVDLEEIDDVSATKPDDWDEDAPLTITDTSAVKPADWLEGEAELVADPDAEKPEEWDVSCVFLVMLRRIKSEWQ